MKLETLLGRSCYGIFLIVFISCTTLLTEASSTGVGIKHSDAGRQIVGQWRGLHHVRAFYADGSFFIDPEPEGRPVGKWRIKGKLLIIQLPGKTTERVEQILRLTRSEMEVTANGKRYSYKRITHY
jgi:hypothetical protein